VNCCQDCDIVPTNGSFTLASLAAHTLGVFLEDKEYLRGSRWDEPLDNKQVSYAALHCFLALQDLWPHQR
jgi:hypothetical protein